MEKTDCPATPPLSSCSATPPRVSSPKSSPSRWTESVDKKEKSPSPSEGRPSSPVNCAICLGSLTNKSFTNSCLHQFCFVCLLEWSKVKAECPLCKVVFNSIIHNVRSQDDYDQYHVKQAPRTTSLSIPPFLPTLPTSRSFRYRTTVTYHEFSEWMAHRTFQRIGSAVSAPEAIPIRHVPTSTYSRPRSTAGTSDFRRSVYRDDLWARLQPDVTGRYRECSPEFYRQNPAQMHRLIPFLNRELNVLLENGSRCAYVMERILELLPQYSMMSSEFRSRVAEYVGAQNAGHFCHELRAYASSPFDIVGYDRSVEYYPSVTSNYSHEISSPSTSNHTIDSDSESDVQIIDLASVSSSAAIVAQSHSPRTHTQPSEASQNYQPSSPQPGPSGLSSRPNNPSVEARSVASSTLVEVSSGSSSDSDHEDVQIVGFVKPRHERTPEIITLSSPELLNIPDNQESTPIRNSNVIDSFDDLYCITLGSNSTASVQFSRNDHIETVSSDEGFSPARQVNRSTVDCISSDDDDYVAGRSLTQKRVEGKRNVKQRRTVVSKTRYSSPDYSSASESSQSSSGEEWEECKKKISKRKSSRKRENKKRRGTHGTDSKGRYLSFDFPDESDAESTTLRKRAKKRESSDQHSPSKAKVKQRESEDRNGVLRGRSRNKHRSSPKAKRKCKETEEEAHPSSSRPKTKTSENSYIYSKTRKCSSGSHHCSRSHSASEESSPQFRGPKLRSIVMKRTRTDEGQESWSVNNRQSSPDTFRSLGSSHEQHRSSRLPSVMSTTLGQSSSSDELTNFSPNRRSRHRHYSNSASSSRRKRSREKSHDYLGNKVEKKRHNRSRSREISVPRSSKWKPRESSSHDSDSY